MPQSGQGLVGSEVSKQESGQCQGPPSRALVVPRALSQGLEGARGLCRPPGVQGALAQLSEVPRPSKQVPGGGAKDLQQVWAPEQSSEGAPRGWGQGPSPPPALYLRPPEPAPAAPTAPSRGGHTAGPGGGLRRLPGPAPGPAPPQAPPPAPPPGRILRCQATASRPCPGGGSEAGPGRGRGRARGRSRSSGLRRLGPAGTGRDCGESGTEGGPRGKGLRERTLRPGPAGSAPAQLEAVCAAPPGGAAASHRPRAQPPGPRVRVPAPRGVRTFEPHRLCLLRGDMEEAPMAIPSSCRTLRLPPGFLNLLEGLAREVIRAQPLDVVTFAAQHFQQLLQQREGEWRCPSLHHFPILSGIMPACHQDTRPSSSTCHPECQACLVCPPVRAPGLASVPITLGIRPTHVPISHGVQPALGPIASDLLLVPLCSGHQVSLSVHSPES